LYPFRWTHFRPANVDVLRVCVFFCRSVLSRESDGSGHRLTNSKRTALPSRERVGVTAFDGPTTQWPADRDEHGNPCGNSGKTEKRIRSTKTDHPHNRQHTAGHRRGPA